VCPARAAADPRSGPAWRLVGFTAVISAGVAAGRRSGRPRTQPARRRPGPPRGLRAGPELALCVDGECRGCCGESCAGPGAASIPGPGRRAQGPVHFGALSCRPLSTGAGSAAPRMHEDLTCLATLLSLLARCVWPRFRDYRRCTRAARSSHAAAPAPSPSTPTPTPTPQALSVAHYAPLCALTRSVAAHALGISTCRLSRCLRCRGAEADPDARCLALELLSALAQAFPARCVDFTAG
jgi:hypothetical protein